ncbi:hypothetical protein LTS18_009131, partial [Coniosporium uncinatum]
MGSNDATAWASLPEKLDQAVSKLGSELSNDGTFKAFTNTKALTKPVTFGFKAAGSDDAVLITASQGKGEANSGKTSDAEFVLSALPEQWSEFFQQVPKAPYQSYWGMFGMNIKQQGIEVVGDKQSWAQHAQLWRRTLEVLHDTYCGPSSPNNDEEPDEDHIVGRYIYVSAPVWGRSKVFYEGAGDGDQEILFLHTAGSDSRQYHGVMNDERMRKKCR